MPRDKNQFNIGDKVTSTVNTVYKGTYIIIKMKKSVCWVKPSYDEPGMIEDPYRKERVYKNVPYRILKKAGE